MNDKSMQAQIRTMKVIYTLTSAFVGTAYMNEIHINAQYGTYKSILHKMCVLIFSNHV